MGKIRLLGDVHADYRTWLGLTDDCEASIQLGDFGIGFAEPPPWRPNHVFIRGNHDNPELCKKREDYLPSGVLCGNIFPIGGAFSIDQHLRTEGVDWWRDEEHSYAELNDLIDKVVELKPAIIVSHAAPSSVVRYLFGFEAQSRTEQALQRIFEIHQPKVWAFAHYHIHRIKTICGTNFVALNEHQAVDLEGV